MKTPIKISNSEIQAFKDCQRKWYLTYYRELTTRAPEHTGPLALGTKIHTVLEAIYTTDDDPLEVLGALYAADRETLQGHPFEADELAKLNKEQDLAHAMIAGFVQWREEEGIDAGLRLHSVEEVIEVEMEEFPGVFLRGKLDSRFIREVDGAILFNDWKTTQTFNDRWLLQLNEQMKFYHLLEFLRDGFHQYTDGALYTMLRKVKRTAAAKPPFYMREAVRHNEAEIKSFHMATVTSVENILRARERLDAGVPMQSAVPPRPSRDCTWKCPFTQVCPMFDDGSRVEDALEALYVHQDPHERYTREETKGESSE